MQSKHLLSMVTVAFESRSAFGLLPDGGSGCDGGGDGPLFTLMFPFTLTGRSGRSLLLDIAGAFLGSFRGGSIALGTDRIGFGGLRSFVTILLLFLPFALVAGRAIRLDVSMVSSLWLLCKCRRFGFSL